MSNTIYALLVGINAYQSPTVNTLRGCANDVEAMRVFLMNQMHVPDGQIKVLLNEGATRQAILDTFKSHLIENPQIQRGDQLLFHYSGHGSRMRSADPNEPDGWDETLVAHDSRMPGIYDIPDKTIAALLDQLAAAKSQADAPGDNITVILDCCHSGSGTRAVNDPHTALTRTAPPDDRTPPADLDAAIRASGATRSIVPTQSGWAITHLLLAGCLDYEESYEHVTAEGAHHGALTYFTLDYLKNPPSNAAYGDLYAWVKPQVSKLYPKQTPQCEGNRKRALFGGAIIESDPFIPVRSEGAGVRLEAGLVHGVREGAELAIYKAAIKTRAAAATATPLATVTVKSVSATSAQADFLTAPDTPLPVDAHALLTKQVYAGIQQRVYLMPTVDIPGEQALDTLRKVIRGEDGTASPHLRLVDEHQPADLVVTADQGQLTIRNQEGEVLVLPADYHGAAGVTETRQALESIARFRALQALANEGQSALRNKIKLGLYRWTAGRAEEVDLAQEALTAGQPLTLPYYPDDRERNKYLVTVSNQSSHKVYAHLFYLGPDFSIDRLYPALSQQELLEPGRTLPCPRLGLDGYSFEMYLPGDYPGEQKWDLSHDALKLIITTRPAELEMLNQPPLQVPPTERGGTKSVSPLDQLLDATTAGSGTRHQRPVTVAEGEDWTTADLSFTVQRTALTRTLEAAADTNIALSDGMVLEKPAGFTGTITVSALPQARTKSATGADIKFPPSLAAQPALFQPFTRNQTRGTEGEPVVLTLTTDEASRQSITAENPLRLRVPVAANEDLLAVAFDGEDYLPVGYLDGGKVNIVHLPQVQATAVAPDQPATKGAWHALQLFLIKKTGRHTDRIGLRYAELNPDATDPSDAVQYRPVPKERLKAGDSVALFVHGFTADTAEMVRASVPFLRDYVKNYSHLLTYDYETFGTTIEQNGETLALALRQQCDFHAEDGITVHVFAHSMGTLVTRCMVELFGGHEIVDRVVLAGPPNNGTTLASISRGFTYLLTAMLNGIANLPLAGFVPWLVGEFYAQGVGWEDLKTDSTIVRRLNGLQTPDQVPYLVLAGNNEGSQAQGDRLNRLAQKLFDRSLDDIFGEPEHDLVIGMSSMRGLRNGAYPHEKVEILPCNHFGYFATAEAQAAMREWFRG